ncbi:MAG: DNA alkylation repair protein [Candidatus Stahlbacteria bacterium]|nr:DNA alkylation repair protein [Candidatus Stahlbacteria bacterium]
MNKIIQKIRAELKVNAEEKTNQSFQRFFKEPVKCYGVKSKIVGMIAKKYWQEVKGLGKKDIFILAEELLASDYCEEAFIVSNWMPKLADQFEPVDIKIFRKWIEKYINNWAKCDGFCNHTVGAFVEKYPIQIKELNNWSKSSNRWLKRASAVSLIIPTKKGKFLVEIFAIADQLLLDKDDMVQKGYGWLLKEASKQHQKEVFDYVARNKNRMPRTALRYAIELMPKQLKAEVGAKPPTDVGDKLQSRLGGTMKSD